uniref:G-protein coupled receptors family 1 profile domain-containing protein n=1 Tax=Sinocyclocheilus anshuiensis TaxID=1608454 RepID=A0A671PK44_9TELE
MCCTYETPMLDQYLPPVMFTEFVLSLMGNVLALSMFFFHRDTWKPNCIYLAHLALADSLVLFCLPFRADYYRRGKDGHNVFYVIQFFVPTAIVIYCITCITWQLKSKTVDTQGKIKRAVQFILAVAAVFHFRFFPSNISCIAMYVLNLWYNECHYFREANYTFKTSVCFTYFNSVGSFRKIYMRLLGKNIEE